AKLERSLLERLEQHVPDPLPDVLLRYSERAHLSEVFPHDVQRPVTDHTPVFVNRDHKLGYCTVELDKLLAEQNSPGNERLHEFHNGGDVVSRRSPNGDVLACALGHAASLALAIHHPETRERRSELPKQSNRRSRSAGETPQIPYPSCLRSHAARTRG